MILSPAQVQRFWREWASTCKALGLTRASGLTAGQIDERRKAFLRECGFDSLTQVDRTAGFTRVLNELIVLRGESVRAARETVDPSLNECRILRHNILTKLIPCLELYVPDVRSYLSEVLFHQGAQMRTLDLMQLTAGQLRRLQYTIAARLNAQRRAAGDSIHAMRQRASVACDCAQCRQPVDSAATFVAPLHGPAAAAPNPF